MCEGMCVFFLCALSCVIPAHGDPAPEHIVLSRTSALAPNNSGSFLVYRIISCLASNSVSRRSCVSSKRLEVHCNPCKYNQRQVEGQGRANFIQFLILFTVNHCFCFLNELEENMNS